MKNKIFKSIGIFLIVTAPTTIMISCNRNSDSKIKSIYKYHLYAPQKSYEKPIDLVINKNKIQRAEINDDYNSSTSATLKGTTTSLQLYKKIDIIFNVADANTSMLSIYLSDFIPSLDDSPVNDEYYTTNVDIFNKIIKDISS